jgi:hypothetical protein
MSGYRRKWAQPTGQPQGTWWHIQWVDSTTFKVECENYNLTDQGMEEWGHFMDKEMEKRFGDKRPQSLTASTLNFSRNDLGNAGIKQVVTYLTKRNIGVQMLKLFKNNIEDEGAYAIGQLIAHSHEPVHEVHLSHNRISETGACSVLESIARSRRYPYHGSTGRRDSRGLTPVWLRFEHNCVNWSAIEHRLDQSKVRWCVAESRDGWSPKDQAPMLCMHTSYRNQDTYRVREKDLKALPEWTASVENQTDSLEAISAATMAHKRSREVGNGQDLLAALQQGGSNVASEQVSEVPMYVFLDASAVRRMLSKEDTLFSFRGLVNLCQQGHMTCLPQQGGGDAPQEHERIIFVVTDSVLEELQDFADRHPGERKRIEWLRKAQDSYLQVCHSWGILEVLETKLHTQLMKLDPKNEQMAQGMHISKRAVKTFDFACLWESQIESEGRVFFVTADEALHRFGCAVGSECTSAGANGTRPLIVLHTDDLDKRLSSDHVHGCWRLAECAKNSKGPVKFCGTVLSASLLAQVVDLSSRVRELSGHGDASAHAEVEDLRRELREALELVGAARHHLGGRAVWGEETEVARCLERMDEAQKRWNILLSQSL